LEKKNIYIFSKKYKNKKKNPIPDKLINNGIYLTKNKLNSASNTLKLLKKIKIELPKKELPIPIKASLNI